MDTHLELTRYDKLKTEICYCKSLNALDAIVNKIIAPTGFGSNSLADTDEPVSLDYQEMSQCLQETDRQYFQYEIDLLLLAQQQLDLIHANAVPEPPPVINPWEMFM